MARFQKFARFASFGGWRAALDRALGLLVVSADGVRRDEDNLRPGVGEPDPGGNPVENPPSKDL